MKGHFKFLFYLGGLVVVLVSCIENNSKKENTAEGTSQRPQLEQPNIVLVEVDDFTQDFLGNRSSTISATPFLDSILPKSTFFENAIVQGVMCTPSRNSLITARYPHELDLYENLDRTNMPDSIWTFPRALQKLGYKTLWVGKNHILPLAGNRPVHSPVVWRNNGLCAMGFDYVYESTGRSIITLMANGFYDQGSSWQLGKDTYGDFLYRNNLMDTFRNESDQKLTTLDPDTEYMDGHFTNEAINLLKNYNDEKPFFLWLNFSGPHHPYDAPYKFHRKFKNVKIDDPIDEKQHNYELSGFWKERKANTSLKQIRTGRKRYLGNIAYMDNQIERLYDYLAANNLLENTYFIFVSDHGISLGDHGLSGKQNFFSKVIKSSLIIQQPSQKNGKTVTEPVELVDLPKTLLNIAQKNNDSSAEIAATVPNGKSLLPYIESTETNLADDLAVSQVRDNMSIVDGKYKLIIGKDSRLLFNLETDPLEVKNIFDENEEISKAILNKLLTLRPKFKKYVKRITG